jgi:putative Mn2+ efflux pump MntP
MAAKKSLKSTAARPAHKAWYDKKIHAIWITVIAFALGYLLSSRAFDTGSWWEYFGAFVCIIIGVNRIFNALFPDVKHGK